MKKTLLPGLLALSMVSAMTPARANGFQAAAILSRPCPGIFVGPVLPVIVPPHAVAGGPPPAQVSHGPVLTVIPERSDANAAANGRSKIEMLKIWR